MKKKVIIRGAIGNRNLGDDLLTYAMVRLLQRMNIPPEITLVGSSKYLLNLVPGVRIKSYYELNGHFNLMVFAGGTQFASFGKKLTYSSGIEAIINNLKNPGLILKKIGVKILKISFFRYDELAFLGIGIGPFSSFDSYYLNTIGLLRKSDALWVRDELSKSICESNDLSFDSGADLVYSMPNSTWQDFKRNRKGVKKIGIIVRDWEFSEANASFMFSLSDLAYKDAEITYYSFCKEKDEKCIKRLAEKGFDDDLIVWNPDEMSFDNFLELISQNDLIITARYHGAVIATLIDLPFISIAIEPKLEMVATLFNMPSWKYPYDLQYCLNFIEGIDNCYGAKVDEMRSIVYSEQVKAKAMMECLEGLLNS